MVLHKGTPEEILTGIANELKPEVNRLVEEIGLEKVLGNIDSSLRRLRERKRGDAVVRFDFRASTPDEARAAIKEGLAREPTATRKVYAALANKTWLLLRGEYTDEIRDWHVLIHATRAFVRERDDAAVERLTALADLLGESIAQFEIHGGNARAPDPAIEELCNALHKALEWPLSAEESDRLWEVLWKHGDGAPASVDTDPEGRDTK